MKTKLNLTVVLFAFLITALSVSAQTPEKRIEQLRSIFEQSKTGQNLVTIRFRTTFPVNKDAVTATATASFAGAASLPVSGTPTIDVTQLPENSATPTATDVKVSYEYGSTGSLRPEMETVAVNIAVRQPESGSSPITVQHIVDMGTVKNYFSNIEILTSRAPGIKNIQPTLALTATKSINKILAKIEADEPVLVQVSAFAGSADTTTPLTAAAAKPDPVWVYKGASPIVRLESLDATKDYTIRVEEVQFFPGRQLASIQLQRGIRPLPTAPTMDMREVSGNVVVIRNNEIKLSLTGLSNIQSLTGIVQKKNKVTGKYEDVGIQPVTRNPATTTYDFTMQAALVEKEEYMLTLTAKNEFSDETGNKIERTYPFTAPELLFAKEVLMTFTKDGIKFKATTGTTKAQLDVIVGIDPDHQFEYRNSTPNPNPEFTLPLAAITSNISAGQGLPITIGVKALDDTGREQKQSLTVLVEKSEVADKAKDSKLKQSLDNLSTSLTATTEKAADKNVNAKSIWATGIQTALRFLLPLL